MTRSCIRTALIAIALVASTCPVFGQAIDPEARIKADGYQSLNHGSDGTPWYTLGETVPQERIKELEVQVARLPKDERLLSVCNLARGGAKAKLIEQSGLAYDVAVTDYGYEGRTIVCVLKFMLGSTIGTQIAYFKETESAVYLYFIKS
ncbi:hypothetical protein I6J77_11875 [Rhodanobacter sp. FDAARGOS 1247]|uniref:hypothetical protein n=1 Tax=Rhodanobacter sp. FDAARGOS 1247 TaxID=2778082 RepID=UPI00194FE415|nr:hypothetical protein [Rhodanobacter sp. FDAARGOS 1247]QRP62829.1 hypothetical protein I6J77_11875 [Rhodanobacter sp. FDAARGOS 1247]